MSSMAPTSAAVGRAEPSRVIREPFFSDRVCTVTFSGERASTRSTVSVKPCTVSVGRPAIRSIFTAKPPTWRTFSRAETISAALWRRPMASSTVSLMVWGFTLTRSTPWRRSTCSFSTVMVSGRPASTVYSRIWDRSNSFSRAEHRRSSCSADNVVGVPPPI